VNMDTGYITLLAPKGGKTVTVPVSDAAMDVLRGRELGGDYVFAGRTGGRRYEFSGPWKRILAKAKIEAFRFHDFRHNFASQLASAGVSIGVIQQLMTHKQIQTTLKYAHLTPGALQDAAQRSAGLINGADNVVDISEAKNGTAS
jgi:integrase